jgi:hypothetical protein
LLDPDLALTISGAVLAGVGWYASSAPPGARNHDGVRQFISRSGDGGASWPAPADLEPTQPDQRSAFAPGPNGQAWAETERAPYLAPAGYTLEEPSQVVVVPSSDDGHTWGSPVTVANSAPDHNLAAEGLHRLPDGTLVAIYEDVDVSQALPPYAEWELGIVKGAPGAPVPGVLRASRSVDGGRTWTDDTQIATCVGCLVPDTAVAPDGSLLITYYNRRSDGSADVELARSGDEGRTWTTSLVTHGDFGVPLLALAARRGQIGVLATENTDSQGDPVEKLFTSADDGASWSALQLAGPYQTSSITNPHFDAGYLGPEEGLVALPGGFGAVFTALAPAPLVDGQEDVDFVRVSDSTAARRSPQFGGAAMSRGARRAGAALVIGATKVHSSGKGGQR